jgi:hypothetical protein
MVAKQEGQATAGLGRAKGRHRTCRKGAGASGSSRETSKRRVFAAAQALVISPPGELTSGAGKV